MHPENITKDEALRHLKSIFKKDKLTPADHYFLGEIIYHVERKVIEDIRERQKKIPGLKITGHGYKAVWGGELAPGCKICLDGHGLWSIRSTYRCNLNCKFCYYFGMDETERPDMMKDHFRLANSGYRTEDDIKIILDKQGDALDGIAWVSAEPFMEFEKCLGLIKYISKKGMHQWMYTNGTLVTERRMKILSSCGLTELRFNLAATNCSRKVINIMKKARKYFKYLCIESPMYKAFFKRFIANKDEILATGVDHINCQELHLNARNVKNFSNEPLYCFKYGYISPISSRHLTYDLIEMAAQEGWTGVTINDCSNEQKFYRGCRKGLPINEIDYAPEWYLPAEWYLDALKRYDFLGL